MDGIWFTAVGSGLFAGAIAIAVSAGIERFGGLMGGVLATLPSSIVPASIGLYSRLQPDALRRAMFTMPAGMLASTVFLLQWRYWPSRLPATWPLRKQLAAMVTISLSVWAAVVMAATAIEAQFTETNSFGIFALCCHAAIVVFGIAASLRPVPAPKGKAHMGFTMMLGRGAIATIAIFTSIMLSQVSGVVAAIASVFPAIFLTVMTSVWMNSGAAVSAGAVGPMVLGSACAPTYALIFAMTAEPLGLPTAVLLSWFIPAICVSIPVALYLRWLGHHLHQLHWPVDTHIFHVHFPHNPWHLHIPHLHLPHMPHPHMPHVPHVPGLSAVGVIALQHRGHHKFEDEDGGAQAGAAAAAAATAAAAVDVTPSAVQMKEGVPPLPAIHATGRSGSVGSSATNTPSPYGSSGQPAAPAFASPAPSEPNSCNPLLSPTMFSPLDSARATPPGNDTGKST